MMLAWFNSSEIIASSAGEERLEQAAVGVEARRVEDRVFHAEELAQRGLKVFMDLLCAANEADARMPVAPLIQRLVGGGDDFRMIGQPEVVIGAQV